MAEQKVLAKPAEAAKEFLLREFCRPCSEVRTKCYYCHIKTLRDKPDGLARAVVEAGVEEARTLIQLVQEALDAARASCKTCRVVGAGRNWPSCKTGCVTGGWIDKAETVLGRVEEGGNG